MDLKQIRYFIHVANFRSFNKAARALAIAQPALSRHIQALELELKTSLLHRTPQGVEPTQAGYMLLSRGETLLKDVEELRAAVARTVEHPSGDVTVGVPPSLSASLAPLILDECRRACPDVVVRLIEGLSVFHVEWINLGRVDLAVLTTLADPIRDLNDEELFLEDMVLVASRDFALRDRQSLSLKEVAELEVTTTHGFRAVIDPTAEAAGLKLRYTGTFDSIPIIKEILFEGRCVTILPYALVVKERFAEELPVLRITDPSPRRRVVIAHAASRVLSPAMKAVHEAVIVASKHLTVSAPT